MRHKLALAVALGTLVAVVVLGASLASAASDDAAGTGAGSQGNSAPAPAPPVVPAPPIGGGVQSNDTIHGPLDGGGAIAAPDEGEGGGGAAGAPAAPTISPDGSTTASPADPSAAIDSLGAAPLGVPNFVIDSFEIPPFLLPIYQACGTQYDIPWQVLASINKIETAFGTNLNVSTAGAMGWMQFIPSTWAGYGVDANGDGRKDPYNPVDAICAAARYLRAAGGDQDLYTAIFAYNHADWYVQEVLLFARAYGKLPDDLVGSLTGLTEGAHFPVAADARYADQISAGAAERRSQPSPQAVAGNAADVVSSSPGREGIDIYSRAGAPVIAVNDGVIKSLGESQELGRYIVLQDAYGNRYTYGRLGEIVRDHPVPKPQKLTAEDFELITPPDDAVPTGPATDPKAAVKGDTAAPQVRVGAKPEIESGPGTGAGTGAAGSPPDTGTSTGTGVAPAVAAGSPDQGTTGATSPPYTGTAAAPSQTGNAGGVEAPSGDVETPGGPAHTDTGGDEANSEQARPRLYALPRRPHITKRAARVPGQFDGGVEQNLSSANFQNYFNDVYGYDPSTSELKPLGVGSKVVGGTVLGRMAGPVDGADPHISFSIRPAGKDAPAIDPKPILDGWKLLEATAIYRAAGTKNPFRTELGLGGVLLLSKEALQRRVLTDPRLEIYSCGRSDIASGQVDRRLLAAMEYLAEKGFRLTITSLKCGHSFLTASGYVSEHSSGNAMDIAIINGVPVTGNQGPGSLADALIRSLLHLQGTLAPHQIISLEDLPGEQSFALSDHYDHVHVGYYPAYGDTPGGQQYTQFLKPEQWQRLIKRLGEIDNPTVPVTPSGFALKTDRQGRAEGESKGGGKAQSGKAKSGSGSG